MFLVAVGGLVTAERAMAPGVKGTAVVQVAREVCNAVWSAHEQDGSRK